MDETLPEQMPNTEFYQVRDVVSLVVNSFRFSRGSGNLQDSLLTFIGHQNRARFKDLSILEDSKPTLEAAVQTIYANPSLHPVPNPEDPENFEPEDVAKAVSTEVDRYLLRLKGGIKFGSLHANEAQNLCSNLIDTENTWIGRNASWVRPPKRIPIRPFSSNLVSHGFLRRSTGRDEFNEVLQFVGNLVLTEPEERWCPTWKQGSRQVGRLISGHVKYNPADMTPLAEVLSGTPFESSLEQAKSR